jgi:hypothetical protein
LAVVFFIPDDYADIDIDIGAGVKTGFGQTVFYQYVMSIRELVALLFHGKVIDRYLDNTNIRIIFVSPNQTKEVL